MPHFRVRLHRLGRVPFDLGETVEALNRVEAVKPAIEALVSDVVPERVASDLRHVYCAWTWDVRVPSGLITGAPNVVEVDPGDGAVIRLRDSQRTAPASLPRTECGVVATVLGRPSPDDGPRFSL